MDGSRAPRRRQYGSGSITQRARDGKWVGRIEAGWTRSGGRRRIEVVGSTRKEAESKLRAKQKEIAREGLPAVRTGSLTVKAWADRWLEQRANRVRPATYQADASQVQNWIVPTIGKVALVDLAPRHVAAVGAAVLAANRSPSTARRAQMVLRSMLRAAMIETGHKLAPELLVVEAQGAAESDRKDIPLPDALAILTAAQALPDASRWVAALLQGMRPAECLGLTWDAIDFERETIDVSWQLKPLPYRRPRDRESGFRHPANYTARRLVNAYHLVRPKTRTGRRVVPLVPWMRAALEDWRTKAPASPYGLVWPAPDGAPRNDKDDRQAWYDLCDAARVAHVEGTQGRRYDLYEARHTTATLLMAGGVPEPVIIAIMGHSSVASTRAYQHSSLADARKALDGVAQRLGLPPSPA